MEEIDQRPASQRIRERIIRSVKEDDLSGLSAEIAYRFLFAVFPFGLFAAALGSFAATYLRVDNPADEVIRGLGDNLPPSIADAIRPELQHLLSSARPDLVSIGAIAALWAATGGTNALIKGMHRAYDADEIRPFLLRYVVAIGLTWFATTHPYIAAGIVAVLLVLTILAIRWVIRVVRSRVVPPAP